MAKPPGSDDRPGDYARSGLPCAGTGAKALQCYHCGLRRSLGRLAVPPRLVSPDAAEMIGGALRRAYSLAAVCCGSMRLV